MIWQILNKLIPKKILWINLLTINKLMQKKIQLNNDLDMIKYNLYQNVLFLQVFIKFFKQFLY